MISHRQWTTVTITLFSLFVLTTGYLQAESLDIEGGLSFRSWSGEVHESTQYSMVRALTFQQNLLLDYSHRNTGYLLTGLELASYSMENSQAKMNILNAGFIGTYYFSRIFRTIRFIYPLGRIHTGISRFQVVAGPSDLDRTVTYSPYIGTGFGLGYSFYRNLHLKTLYLFDTHFFDEGMVFAHSIYLSISYRIDL